ncbi:helix-turn-helix domain-containing protein [Sinorhizobium fredii]|uniref:helix-turn-helix domain-containing protein n=1 Tax=Rhizobium fredii TaxID=380 RepID=UPI0005657AF8|nr:helix-turn-helix domain-containing protein [Sinorhizobium fredii]
MSPTIPLDTIYTADEAAERLRVTRRTMIKLGRDLGSCSKIGREYHFSERDLLDIWQAQRAMPTSSQGRAVNVKGFLSDFQFQQSLRRLTKTKRRRRQ